MQYAIIVQNRDGSVDYVMHQDAINKTYEEMVTIAERLARQYSDGLIHLMKLEATFWVDPTPRPVLNTYPLKG